MATPPSFYPKIAQHLGDAGLNRPVEDTDWVRVIVEKPFGRDLHSAQDLNTQLHQVFDERQIFRIDHYLGKETVQNILVFRFANGIFEPLWTHQYIDHVQITVAESLGVKEEEATMTMRAPFAIWCKTICCNWCRLSPWSRRWLSRPTRCAMKS